MKEEAILLNEKARTYHYSEEESLTFYNVIELIVRESGSHRLKTTDGNLHIILPGFKAITVHDEKEWTV